jgi:tetratricopeptide (TPR) repeat protein
MLIGLGVFLGAQLHGQQLSARDWFLMGSAKYKCHACSQAVEDFTKAIELKKDYSDAYYGRALSFLCIQNTKAASSDIEQAIRLNNKEVLYYECRARIKSANNDHKGAAKDFQEAITKDSDCWQAWYGLASSAHALHDTARARIAYDSTIVKQPGFVMGWLGRGALNLEDGKPAAAIADLERARTMEPGYHPIFLTMTKAHLKMGNLELAEENAYTASRLEPEDAESHFLLGESKLRAGKYSQADLDFMAAAKLDKKLSEAFFKRAICHDSIADYQGARKYYTAAIGRNKTMKAAYLGRHRTWLQGPKPKAAKAISDLSMAIKIDRDDASTYLKRADLYLNALEFQKAMQDYAMVIKKQPQNTSALYGLGLAKFGEGNRKGACDEWMKAAALGDERATNEMQKNCTE